MKYIKLLLLLLVIAEAQTTFGQGWTVSGNYAYDMTVTSVLNANCTELKNPSNKLGAFVGGELRGVALSSTVVNGRYVALLTIHSNVASAEIVNFKIYNAVTGDIINATTNVLFQDDAVYGTPSDPYEIRTNSVPVNILLATKSTQENTVAALITTMSVNDPDVGDTHTYSLVAGVGATDNAKFIITGNQLYSVGALNYDVQNKYKIRIKAEDNHGCSMSDTFTILLIDRNFPPTNIIISKDNVDENKAIGSVVGTLSTVDPDNADVFMYTLVSGVGADDNAKFSLTGNTIKTNALFDFETTPSYKIRVQTKDSGGNIIEKAFVISVNNVNDKPNISDKTLGIEEQAPNGKVLGTMSGTDADMSQTLSYSFYYPTNTSQSIFGINETSGEVSLLSNTLNYKTTQSYTLMVVVLDNGTPRLSDTATLRIVVLYQNFPPTNISISNVNINENIPVGTQIAEFITYDKNVEDVFTYTLVDGINADDNGSFTLVGKTLSTNNVIDYETKSSYNIRVQTKDLYGNTFQKTFVINVTDINEKPELRSQIMTVNEDATVGAIIGTMEATNEDRNQFLSFYIVNEGVPQTTFKINQQTGEISLLTATLNYTTKQSYTFKIAVWDTGIPKLSDTTTLQIMVLDKNYAPTDLLISNNYKDENQSAKSVIGVFSTVDSDVGEIFTYSLVSGASSADNNQFTIKSDTLLSKSSFNYELKASYAIRVQTKDSGGNVLQQEFTIYVNDINEIPVLSDQTIGVEENTKSGVVFCTMHAVDEDENQDITYSFVNANSSNKLFTINALTGEVSLISNALDYEKNKSYTFRVAAVDNGNPSMSDTATLVINILDVIEATLPSVDYVSANGDGKNDYWFIENIDIYFDYSLMIFDANGIMVYKIDRGYDNSWNGLYNGTDLPIGTYYYVFSSNDKSRSFKGTITLVR